MLAGNSISKEEITKTIVKQIINIVAMVNGNKLIPLVVLFIQTMLFSFIIIKPAIAEVSFIKDISYLEGETTTGSALFWIFNGCILSLLLQVRFNNLLQISNDIGLKLLMLQYLLLQGSVVLYHINTTMMIMSSSISIPIVIVYACSFPASIFLFYVQPELHLIGVASVSVRFLQKIMQFNLWQAFFLAIVLYYSRKMRTVTQKFCCLVLLLFQLWAFCYRNIDNSNTIIMLYPVFHLGIAIFLLVYFQSLFRQTTPENSLFEIVRKFKEQKKGEKRELELKISQKIEILHIIEQLGEEQDLQAEREAVLNNKVRPQNVFSILAAVNRGQKDKWLQAQVQVLRNESALRIFRLLGEIEPESIHETVRLQQLKQRAEANNSVTSSKQIDVRVVQQTNAEIESFYQQIYRSAEALVEFWKDVSESNLKTTEVSGKFKTVMDHQDEAKRCLERAKKMHACLREKELLGQWENITNHYLEESEDSHLNSLHRKLGLHLELIDYDFVVLSNNEIKDISERLLVELGLLRQGKYLLEQSQLFPQRLISIIFHNLNLYRQSFYLPLVVENRLIVKRATVHLLPAYDSQAKYLITLTPSEVHNAFLFDVAANEILCFSADFFRYLQATMLPSAVMHIPSEIFTISLRDEAIELWQKGSSVDCQLRQDCCKMLKRFVLSQLQTIKITLKMLSRYDQGLNTFFLVDIKGIKSRYQKLVTLKVPKSKESQTKSNVKQSSLTTTTATKQIVFCKIKNPYAEYILEKIQSHKKIKSLSNPYIISIIIAFLTFLSILALILVASFANHRHSEYESVFTDGNNLNTEYQIIISLFYQSHIRYYIKMYEAKVNVYDPNLSVSGMLTSYTTSISNNIKKIVIDQMQNPFQPLKQQINYEIKYEFYSIQASTLKSDLFNVLQEIKKSLVTYNMTFLVNNYNQIRSLENTYKVSTIAQKNIRSFADQSNYLVISVIAPAIILTITIYVILWKTKIVIDTILSYLAKVTFREKHKIMKNIDRLLKKHPILIHLDNINKQKCSQMLYNSIKLSADKDEGQTKMNIRIESPPVFLAKHYSYSFLLIFLILSGIFYQQYVKIETQQFVSLIQYNQRMQSCSDFVLTQMTDALNAEVWKELYNTTNIYNRSNSIELKTSLHSDSLPDFFSSYKRMVDKRLYQDLCLSSYLVKNISFLDLVSCNTVFDGALRKGFSMVYQNYRTNLQILKEASISQLLDFRRRSDRSPIFLEAGYTRRLITRLIQQLSDNFIETTRQYSIYLSEVISSLVLLVGIFSVILAVGVGIKTYYFQKEGECMFNLLKTIPREILLNVKLSKSMRETNFLSSLERI